MAWHTLHNADQPHPFYYIAYGKGGPGDGERTHRHTVSQTFTCIAGRLQVTVNGCVRTLLPGHSMDARTNEEHGLLVLEGGTEWISIFFERDCDTIDWERIRKEQVPSLTSAEIIERASQLTSRR